MNPIQFRKEKETIKAYANYDGLDNESKLYKYKCEFKTYIKNIVLDNGIGNGNVIFPCESWVHSKHENTDKRIFFTDKSYLPSETPVGLKSLREKDLESLRGNGEGERKTFERIYDYDTYNDIGDPETDSDLSRPVLGGEQHPYPRRCRTGREMTSKEPWSESRTGVIFYVPRDEDFSEIKEISFGATTLYSVLNGIIPMLDSTLTDANKGFSLFRDIESLYNDGIGIDLPNNGLLSVLTRLLRAITNTAESILQFATPRIKDKNNSRGIAVEHESAPHGLKLTIEDYPFANDGLVLWDAIKQWATTYINHYYPQPSLIESDKELQAWWTEIRTVGHGDKKDEPWWPQLKTQEDMIKIITTIMWVSSGHHSAVNFGQYDFAGYFPNRPTIARTKMPNEDPTVEEWEAFISKPEDALLDSFPTQIQATRVMSVLVVLSTHSPDEEYIGTNMEPAWAAEPAIKAAFEEFSCRLKELEAIIDSRNNDPNLRNRSGAGLVPYQLLKPFSESGLTGKGVPYSISI
ncbi:hypothetical protein L1987_10499 [Smallanthus sonchifolius]|uniref:Uncharacterized protein n=1 Tax=Smallanthus sonchifolius TaxID=185202 RepID=A0ACB9JS94_9ASTR|nr:hypothetical protein L1987_10499 [Smallanthus sonchifolius]